MALVPDIDLTTYQPQYSSEDLRRAKGWMFRHNTGTETGWKYKE